MRQLGHAQRSEELPRRILEVVELEESLLRAGRSSRATRGLRSELVRLVLQLAGGEHEAMVVQR